MTFEGPARRNETLEVRRKPIRSHAEDSSRNHTPSREEIRLRAQEVYFDRGDLPGSELHDWVQAECELQRTAPPNAKEFLIKREAQ
jgi:DUF2934 family protein